MSDLLYDPLATIRAFALSNSALSTRLSGRMYYPTIPESNNSFPAIAYQIISGPYSQYIPYGIFIVEFRCYASESQSPKDAADTFKYLFNAIHDKQNITVTDVEGAAGDPTVYWSKCVQSARPLNDPHTHWHFNRSLFEIAITHNSS